MEEKVKEVITELTGVLEATNDEIFFLTIQELINTHQSTKSCNPLMKWDILLLPHFYDHDEVLAVANQTALEATIEALHWRIAWDDDKPDQRCC